MPLPGLPELLVTLASSGALAALFNIIQKVLERHKNQEIQIKRNDATYILKGHSVGEARELLTQLLADSAKEAGADQRRT